MNWTIASHLVYLAITVPLTIWVASTLSRNGRVFLADVFQGDEGLADAVNRLLVVGFYLLNLGFVTLFVRSGRIHDAEGLFDSLSVKVGVVLLTLGVLHFVNVYVFNRLRRRHRIEEFQRLAPPPPMPRYPVAYGPAYPAAPR
ncbi:MULTISPECIES: hypothetical protein [Pimelobacter]|uniref:hypothetical protein n=1 Tax=Pimelobacter TaxID=2044 RepID=UPI001C03B77B|nr:MULTISPECIES: hypothetical protein [Pimelobacter]MBU2694940.1 hypothetical protein [Pimelobacter sp. 30-1]UUW92862.1 hypothetical protein M0M43_09955 [Pimelobacter simplex]UUW98892.1 hypothetical protein M0M48_28455 [Pimelobacter simplex]